MYKKIIIALSLEHGIADRAIDAAKKLVDDDGEIVAVHVYEPMHSSVSVYVSKEDVAKAVKTLEDALEGRVQYEDKIKAVLLKGQPGRTITEYAEKMSADCIVVGSHKPGLEDFLLGSSAARIVRHAPCSVHVIR